MNMPAFILAVAQGMKPHQEPQPNDSDLAAFAEECRTVSIIDLGNLLFTAPTSVHRRVAEKIASERLREQPR